MRTFKSLILGYIAVTILVFATSNLKAQSSSTDTSCSVNDGVARIMPRGVSDVREVTILRPDGGVVYLYSPQLSVYNLASLKGGAIEVNPSTQFGSQYAEDGKLHPRKIFSDSGNYRLIVLGKATKASSQVLYSRSGCSLDFTEGQGFQRVRDLGPISVMRHSFTSVAQWETSPP